MKLYPRTIPSSHIVKPLLTFILIALPVFATVGQSSKIDSLDRLISKATTDTARINLEIKKLTSLSSLNLDTAISFALKTLEEAKKISFYKGEVMVRGKLAGNYIFKGDYAAAEEQLTYLMNFIKLSEDSTDFAYVYGTYGFFYSAQSRQDTAIVFYEKAIRLSEQARDSASMLRNYINTGIAYQLQSNYPMAIFYQQKTLKIAESKKDEINTAYAHVNLGIIYGILDDFVRAEKSYLDAAALGKKNELTEVVIYAYANLSSLYLDRRDWRSAYKYGINAASLGEQNGDHGVEASSLSRAAVALVNMGKPDSAATFSDKAIAVAVSTGQPLNLYQTYTDRGSILYLQQKLKEAIPFYEKGLSYIKTADSYMPDYGVRCRELSECYEGTGNYVKALEMFKKSSVISDSVRNEENVRKSTELTMNYDFDKKQQLQKVEQKVKDSVQKEKQVALVIALSLMLVIAAVAFIGYRNKQKANSLLQLQKGEIETTLGQLKSTQAQLIQSEKMASLGELTSGIAHEIQNPLNFVNNFSEINEELLTEMKEELIKGNSEDAIALANDALENQRKINHHGKRADSIVKGMLQHSRSSSGIKEPTDINALCDEYLRLSYHGLRARDKSFNARFETDFDTSLEKINVVPQDIGRVVLNLLNNAFYAVNEKKRLNLPGYEPTVIISTQRIGDLAEIKISDNGNGVPQKVLDKIFQPFFTTKPTGQGTGLGLSLSYDVVKVHGGEIKVETTEGQGTTFKVILPAT